MFANTDWYLYNFRLALAIRIRELGHEVVLVSPPGDYGEKLRDMQFNWIPLKMDRRSVNPFQALFVIVRLTRLYKEIQPDICHHFTVKSVLYGGLASILSSTGARVHAIAGLGYIFGNQGLVARLLRPFVKLGLKAAFFNSNIIVQNPDDRDELVGSGLVDSGKVHLIRGSGVNTEKFAPMAADSGDSGVRVLMATRLLWDKGVQEFIECAERLSGKEGFTFEIAGEPDAGNPDSVPLEKIQQWHNDGAIKWLGHVDDMSSLLPLFDLVVLPSRYREGIPRILIEAAACGLPLITTDMPGCREIVHDGKNGILVEPGNVDALEQAVLRLGVNPKLRAEYGKFGRALVQEEFGEEAVIRRTVEVYELSCS